MLLLQGKPILEYIVRHLAAQGAREIAINLHFQPKLIREYFGAGSRFGVTLVYSHEPELLGTAGAVKKLSDFLGCGDDFLVHYGDVVTDQDFGAMMNFHRQHSAITTLLLHRRALSNSTVTLDGSGRVTEFRERPSASASQGQPHWVNSGIYICSPTVLQHIPDMTPCDFPRDVFPTLLPTNRLFGFPLTGYRCAIDSVARLAEASALARTDPVALMRTEPVFERDLESASSSTP
jgi:mannose-1-phosphate guanylyltransferase/phosphomannomutase